MDKPKKENFIIGTYKGVKYAIFYNNVGGGVAFYCGYVRIPYKHPYRKFCLYKEKIDIKIMNWEMEKMIAAQKKVPFDKKRPKKTKPRFTYCGYKKMNIETHGGLTFARRIEDWKLWPKGNWIGWDYGHAGDEIYVENLSEVNPELAAIHHNFGEKRWTKKEVAEDCFKVIDQLLRIK